jgi:hypothetical protein
MADLITFDAMLNSPTFHIRHLTFLVVTILALALLPHGIVHADGITVTTNEADYAFAQQMTFHIAAQSDMDIKSAIVVFRSGNGPEHRAQVTFEPSKTIDIPYVQRLTGDVLSPFSQVTYWWELSDAAGRKHSTLPQTIEYGDNRFAWQDISESNVRVFYYAGDVAYAQSALSIARAALVRINEELAAPLPPRVDVYLYASLDDLQSALLLAGRDWQGGQARPDLGVVLVAIPPGQEAMAQMKRDIPHELTHLLVFQATGPGYARVPRWLDEGLASANEELAQPSYQLALEAAFRNKQLMSLETLCAPFPADAGLAQLAYAQSQSFVQFLRNRDPGAIRRLLGAYAGGATCSGGVEQAMGSTLGALELAWRASLGPQGAWLALIDSVGGWVVMAVLVSLALIPLAFVTRKPPLRKRKS